MDGSKGEEVKKLAVVVGIVGTLALAGCASVPSANNTYEFDKTLKDGTKVTCLSHNNTGLWCKETK